jgi:hypothetical protein
MRASSHGEFETARLFLAEFLMNFIARSRPLFDIPDKAIEATYGVNILSHYWVNKTASVCLSFS